LEKGGYTCEKSLRATSITALAERIFPSHSAGREGIRALIWLRAATDSWPEWFSHPFPDDIPLPRFRAHAFLRALEGLYAAPLPSPSSASTEERDQHFFADLKVESGLRYGERHYDN
ncbi:MAG: hypothetical protein E7J78_15105, partial [Pantoea sp.]|nr:hypothetical protein [Pantoea sp.]